MMRFTGARAGRVAALIVTIGVVLGLASASAGAAGSTNPKQVDGKGIITIEQTNMCLWGSIYYGNDGCLHNPYYTQAKNPTEAFDGRTTPSGPAPRPTTPRSSGRRSSRRSVVTSPTS